MEPLGASVGQISDVTRSLCALHDCWIIICQAMDISMNVDPSIESRQALGIIGPMKSSYCISTVRILWERYIFRRLMRSRRRLCSASFACYST